MDTPGTVDPVHEALAEVASVCIDENFLEEAERLLVFLEMTGASPYTAGLLRVWARTQRGDLRDALRDCSEMVDTYPDMPDLLALLGVLRFACGERNWRPVCERLLELPNARAESRLVATSLLDGSFGRKNPLAVAAAEPKEPEPTVAAAAYDFAHTGHYLRG